MTGPRALAQEDDDRVTDLGESLDLDIKTLPWFLDLPHVLDPGVRPAKHLILVKTAAGPKPDRFRIEALREAGEVLSGDQVEECPNDGLRLGRHEGASASTNAFSACALASRSRRSQRFKYGFSNTWAPDSSGR